MKNFLRSLVSLYSFVLFSLFIFLPSFTPAAVIISGGYVNVPGPDPPCPGGICTTFFTTGCGLLISLEAGGDLNFDVESDLPGAATIEEAHMPIPNASFVFTGPGIKYHFQWNPTPFVPTTNSLFFIVRDAAGNILETCTLFYDFPLPVELASFVAAVQGNTVKLDWQTSSETNNSRFEIERALVNGNTPDWHKVGTVNGNGTTNNTSAYSFSDKGVNVGHYSYRLKQIDFNGNSEYFMLSGEVIIGVPSVFKLSQNYPNPFNPVTKIDFELPQDGNVNLVVYDNSGKMISTMVSGQRSAGYYSELFNAANISSGVYYYKLEYKSDNLTQSKVMKMIILK